MPIVSSGLTVPNSSMDEKVMPSVATTTAAARTSTRLRGNATFSNMPMVVVVGAGSSSACPIAVVLLASQYDDFWGMVVNLLYK